MTAATSWGCSASYQASTAVCWWAVLWRKMAWPIRRRSAASVTQEAGSSSSGSGSMGAASICGKPPHCSRARRISQRSKLAPFVSLVRRCQASRKQFSMARSASSAVGSDMRSSA